MKRTGAIGFVTAVALWLGTAGALAAGPQHRRVSALGGSCRGSASAIAQYCEEVPTPGGGRHPGPGTPTVVGTLPSGAVARLVHTQRLWPLLRIPAGPTLRGVNGRGLAGPSGSGVETGSGAGGADSASIWTPLILTLALIALLLGGLDIVRRRRLSGRPG